MAARSVKCIFVNDTDRRLRLKQPVALDHGIWSKGTDPGGQPPREIGPGAQATWESESSGFMTGTEGRAIYEAEDGATIEVWWDNPYIGDNKFSLTVGPEGTYKGKYEGGDGDNATVTFSLSRENVQAAASPVPGTPAPRPPPPPEGTLSAQATCGTTVHLSPPADSKDVMIVPSRVNFKAKGGDEEHQKEIMRANNDFAKQWAAADPQHRKVLEINVDATWADFEKTMLQAAKIARGREIILMTGHGGAAGERGVSESTMDTVPESDHRLSKHKHSIKAQDIAALQGIAKLEGDKLVPIPPNAQSMVDSFDPWKFLGLLKIGKAFRENGVSQFTGLTCNIGRDTQFGYTMANLLQTKFRAYKNLVATGEELGQIQVWIVEDEDNQTANQPEHNGEKNHPSFHEIPTYLQKVFEPDCP